MTEQAVHIGDITVTRLEESYGPSFPANMLLPSWDPSVRDDHGPDTIAQFVQPDTDLALMSIHTWVVRTPQSTILVDTCNGNHKERAMEEMAMLNTDWLERLVASGVQPDEVDAVVCTHIHLDHVGWNTSLVDGKWVPTFPNAKYFLNKTEYEFWNPSVSDQTGLEFNANVFADSISPIFDRDLVQLWDGDGCQIDDSLTLELKPGHTPGHAIGWLESKGQQGLLSGDSMHSPVQVYRPDWNSGFCLDAAGSIAARRSVLEAAVERNAVLLPAHFSAPHAFHVQEKGDGFAVVDAL
ncbi:MAG: glyoxylase-like metal-dependent hydrolase (beta-lactamase superfamily II) [Acidimicrobiales bacterium]|jgi:glyoxylase-like metal-dependent hydrolase (beta-lactamase superfamily II)